MYTFKLNNQQMTLNKKIIIGISSIVVVLVTANFGLNLWLEKKLPQIIQENNTTPYEIGYKKLTINIWSTSIQADTVVISPKVKPKNSKEKLGIYGTINTISVANFSIWELLMGNTIRAQSITINQPDVILYYQKEKDKDHFDRVKNDVIGPFEKIIKVHDIYLKEGAVTMVATTTNKVFFDAKNVAMNVEGIKIDENTLQQKIPFTYSKYELKIDSILYQPNVFYKMRMEHLIIENHELKASNFQLLPLLDRHQFVQTIKTEKDLFIVKAKEFTVSDIDWGFKNEHLFFNVKNVLLDKVDANIYRNKMPADDLSKKKLYSELLRNLKFAMTIENLEMRNSKLVYEEEVTFDKGPAVLTFDRFNLKATNIQSGLGLIKTEDLKIKINCIFMKNSALHVDWKFNVLDKNDSFNIKGTIADFDLNAMKRFTMPYVNASFDGKFKKYKFDIWGNDVNSKGNASLDYDDLDVTFYKKKEPRKEAKLKSAVANLFVKKDSDEHAKTCTMELERIQEKSFYNFLWRNVAESLKKILI